MEKVDKKEAPIAKGDTEAKQLKGKAMDIKGKKYVMVRDRVMYFNEHYPNGCITTGINSDDKTEIIFRAVVIPDVSVPQRVFTGHAGEIRGGAGVNKTSALENAETSAIGRALAMMGIGVIDSIVSVDEINKAENAARPATESQIKYMKSLNSSKGMPLPKDFPNISSSEAGIWIGKAKVYVPQKRSLSEIQANVDEINAEKNTVEDDSLNF